MEVVETPIRISHHYWKCPEGSGLDLCRWIRSQTRPATTPSSISQTVRSGVDNVVRPRAGADDDVQKPVCSRKSCPLASADASSISRPSSASSPPNAQWLGRGGLFKINSRANGGEPSGTFSRCRRDDRLDFLQHQRAPTATPPVTKSSAISHGARIERSAAVTSSAAMAVRGVSAFSCRKRTSNNFHLGRTSFSRGGLKIRREIRRLELKVAASWAWLSGWPTPRRRRPRRDGRGSGSPGGKELRPQPRARFTVAQPHVRPRTRRFSRRI